MGKTKQSSSRSLGLQSSLANTQEKILKDREQIFKDYYLPEFKDFYSSLSPDSEAGKAQMGLMADEINASFDAAQKQTNQMINQQNLDGSGAGLALLAANARERSSALAKAYASRMAETTANKGNALAQLGSMVPSPTTAAPILDSSRSAGYTNAIAGNII